MAQVRKGSVYVATGSATVRHIWIASFLSYSGEFAVGDSVEWGSGSGAGIVTFWDSVQKEVRFYRTAGIPPSVGDTFVTTPANGFGDIVLLGENDPPGFVALIGVAEKAVFTVPGTSEWYEIASVPEEDLFVLSSVYTSDTGVVNYGVHTTWTENLELPILETGDADAPVLLSLGMQIIDDAIGGGAGRSLFQFRKSADPTVDGGTATSGAWRSYLFTDVVQNSIVGASLVSAELTLPIGTYQLEAYALGHMCNTFRLRLVDTTNSDVTVVVSPNLVSGDGNVSGGGGGNARTATVRAPIRHQFTIEDEERTYRFDYRCETTRTTDGLGVGSPGWNEREVFGECFIWKIS